MCYSILIETDLKKIESLLGAQCATAAFARFAKLADDGFDGFKPILDRIYPNYFAPLVTVKGGQRTVLPMRYRLRPAGSKDEVPSKYNLFNARIDKLTTRRTWSSIFMRNHGLLVAKGFYEWVTIAGNKRVVKFAPESRIPMVFPVIYDTWVSHGGRHGFSSFAVLTGEPPPEVLNAGHDRCPIWLSAEDDIRQWLSPESNSAKGLVRLLQEATLPDKLTCEESQGN